MEVCDNLNDKYRYSLSLGRVYSEVGQTKKAEDCFCLLYTSARLRSEKSKRGGLDLLQRISAKDLRDVTLEVYKRQQ